MAAEGSATGAADHPRPARRRMGGFTATRAAIANLLAACAEQQEGSREVEQPPREGDRPPQEAEQPREAKEFGRPPQVHAAAIPRPDGTNHHEGLVGRPPDTVPGRNLQGLERQSLSRPRSPIKSEGQGRPLTCVLRVAA
eukprot:CAMPEP_0179165294 /NCGR_PEP_ID=MMETSP0796-20121207/81177_1 /TAXON_ID=73915 /ORGANISM="Pyrodinium bahamense, Strain pbaha01" /LENGTH=139 /DNA_ID=CAMNT_0020867843 /DNA_START=29 /DNA_END=448 /DNA_ORIENTATION=-